MMSVHFITFLQIVLLSNNAFGKFISEDWTEERIQALETAVQFAGCQRYLAHGYRYEHMYPIDGLALDNTEVKKTNNELSTFKMHMAIKAARDGLILLSPFAEPGANDLVFEIGVGTYGNSYTILRVTKDSTNEVARHLTPNIINASHFTKLYIAISDDVLTVGKEGEPPIISYADVRLRSIKYFDISSWGTNEGKFLYDCPSI